MSSDMGSVPEPQTKGTEIHKTSTIYIIK